MTTLTFAYNEDTLNTEISIDEDFNPKDAKLNITCIKSYDDEIDDVYEFDIDENECEITNLKFKDNGDNCYEILFNAKIQISNEKWENASEKFKKNAVNGLIEVEFDLECDGTTYEEGEHFEKQTGGQTELFVD